MSNILYPDVYADLNNNIPVSEQEWAEFCEGLTLREFRKKDLFMSAGDDPKSFGIVMTGVFRLYFVRPDGKEFIKTFRQQYQVAGALAEITLGISSRIFIEAVTPAKMLVGNFDHFDKMCEKYPNWMKIGRLIALQSYVDKEQREFELLQLSAMERYENFKAKFSQISDQIPNYQIASYLGITPVAFSRMLNN